MLKIISGTREIFANSKFRKAKETILLNISKQAPLLSRISRDPNRVLQHMLRNWGSSGKQMSGPKIENGLKKAETKLLDYLITELDGSPTDKNRSNAFDAIMLHYLIFPIESEKRIFEEVLPLVADPSDGMQQFAIAIGKAWDNAFTGSNIDDLWINEDFGNPAKPANALFSLKNPSPISLGNMLKEIDRKRKFIDESNECDSGELNEFNVEILNRMFGRRNITRAIVRIQMRESMHEGIPTYGDNGLSTKMIELIKKEGGSNLMRMSIAMSHVEEEIGEVLKKLTRRMSIGFNDLFGKNM